MKLQDCTVLLTGAGRRVGAALARALAEGGARLVLHCHTAAAEAHALAASLPGGATRRAVLVADLEVPGAAAALFDDPACARVNVLINNASIFRRAPLLADAPDAAAELAAHLAVNFTAPVELMRCFAARSGARPGAIVNLVDSEVERPAASDGAYSLSKRLLREATLAAARELAPRIRVNALAPGPVLAPDALAHLKMKQTLARIPLGRAPCLEELISGCRFLIENDAVTGQTLYIDCGMHLA